MPVVFIHGVATRAVAPSETVATMIRRYVAPALADDPADVPVIYAYWGDDAADLRWHGVSRPRTPLLGMGGVEDASPLRRAMAVAQIDGLAAGLPAAGAVAPSSRLAPAGPDATTTSSDGPAIRLKDFGADELSDLLATTMVAADAASPELLIAADDVARDLGTPRSLALAADVDGEWQIIESLIGERVTQSRLTGMGGDRWLARVGDRVKESAKRGAGLPGFVASRMVSELRPKLNSMASLFLGDILVYLTERGTAEHPGPIPRALLDAFDEAKATAADQPLVVLSHSMGGQVTYDVLTRFMGEDDRLAGVGVDFWAATASQVGFFEELGLFLASDADGRRPRRVPFPDRLGVWWNVWDNNDFLSFTAEGIFDGVDDEGYDSGMGLIGAHSGYLVRPSFYRRFADKLVAAASDGWRRP